MTTAEPGSATILIATADKTDAEIVRKNLAGEFSNVFITIDAELIAQDFERRRPDVLVLAFGTLEKCERYYLGLYRLCPAVQQRPHRTIILCNKDEVGRVFELCKKNYFDDYVLFWPMTYDMSRLSMSVHHALRELAALKDGGPSLVEFAAQARRLGELEKLLDDQMARGTRHTDVASRAMAKAEQDVGATLDDFTRRLSEGALLDAVTVNSPDALNDEVSRIKRVNVGELFRAAAESAAPLKEWTAEFKHDLSAQMASIRALNALADSVRPIVLVVDDDELQQKLIKTILAAENYQLIFAASGVEALAVLRRARPDVILMDFMMSGMDGIETTRRLKTVPQFAKLPVIMITGKSEGSVVVDSLKAGATGFLVKPFNRDTLITKLREALMVA
jgi:CheY-like chemotaxis protein